ncbi:hypothetical protein N0B51_09935 [Tsuneonella sp. YG55]|jgi:hypothetical protein|uniref:Uncharacterized protein n=1 Tax=Tsuneonella litorea TaxID=2976475 RepID=A0A9X2W2C7_9SPHN|nr:hypothetical protein [Tsuneonella litorea]MCT2559303.1 hypothetical protein [Tsuneonella litorea]
MVTIVRAVEGCPNIPPNFPILLTNSMKIIEPAFEYLMEVATLHGRTRSRETLRTYGEHLYDWFDSLEQSGIAWHDVCAQTIAARQRAQDHAGHYPHSCPASGTGANHTPIDRQEPFLSAPETEHRRAAGAPTGSNGKSLHPDYAPITETRR